MNPVSVTVTLTSGTATSIAGSQSPLAAGYLTLTASPVVLTAVGLARQVILTSGGNDTLLTFTIKGTNASGLPQSEVLAGASGAAATSVLNYQTVSSIYTSRAVATTIEAGTNGVGASRVVNPDIYQSPFNVGIGCEVTGTVNYTVQHTFDDIFSTNNLTWFSNSGITGKTANQDGNYAFAVRGIQLLLNSGSGSVTMKVVQGTHY